MSEERIEKSEKKRKIFTVLRTVKINNFSSLFTFLCN